MGGTSSYMVERSSGDPSISPSGLRSPALQPDIQIFICINLKEHHPCKKYVLSDRFRDKDPLFDEDRLDPFEDQDLDLFFDVIDDLDICGCDPA